MGYCVFQGRRRASEAPGSYVHSVSGGVEEASLAVTHPHRRLAILLFLDIVSSIFKYTVYLPRNGLAPDPFFFFL